jgi:hypothetical protein
MDAVWAISCACTSSNSPGKSTLRNDLVGNGKACLRTQKRERFPETVNGMRNASSQNRSSESAGR